MNQGSSQHPPQHQHDSSVDLDISMCPVVGHGKSAQKFMDIAKQQPGDQNQHYQTKHGDNMDISLCPVHGGQSMEAFASLAQHQRQIDQQRAYQHIQSDKFLEGAPRFPIASKPTETDDDNLVGDIFPDSKPIYGQRYLLSTSPARSNIPKSTRSKALPPLQQLPEQVPQVPNHLKHVAQLAQQQQQQPLACTSIEADSIAVVDGKEVILPGKDFQEDTWTFPSHQRFYNAMKKKGWAAAEVDIPYIVSIHNTINQQAWQRIMSYERYHIKSCPTPSLLKFQGRPNDLSPKARILSAIGYNPPFDRHDWTIDRCGTDVRYIIDFYDGAQVSPHQPVSTHLDVRPALDSPGAFIDIIRQNFDSMFEMKRHENP